MNVSVLLNKILLDVKVIKDSLEGDDEILFIVSPEEQYKLYHDRDCCETVSINDITGDINDLIGSVLVEAEKSTNKTDFEDGSYTWTFYRFRTAKGCVSIRWYGESNGYYSESVDFIKVK